MTYLNYILMCVHACACVCLCVHVYLYMCVSMRARACVFILHIKLMTYVIAFFLTSDQLLYTLHAPARTQGIYLAMLLKASGTEFVHVGISIVIYTRCSCVIKNAKATCSQEAVNTL